MFVTCGIWCLANVLSVSPLLEQVQSLAWLRVELCATFFCHTVKNYATPGTTVYIIIVMGLINKG